MEKDIFAPYEIAKQLKEIGFDEPCIAYFHHHSILKIIFYSHNFNDNQSIDTNLSAPTWEQIFKWFRGKGYLFVIGYDFSDKKYNYKIVIKKHNEISRITSENYPTYEQARENLALELIEIYKNEQRTDKK